MKKFLLSLALVLTAGVSLMALDIRFGTINVPTGLAGITNTTLTSTAGTALTLQPNQALMVMPSFTAGAGDGASNIVFGFNVTADGTNWTTSAPLTITNTCNNATAVIGHGLLTAAQLEGVKQIRFGSLTTTATNGVTISAIRYGYTY